jgi:putative zinc finger/helix-turn-helix YgiT family protein
MDEAFTIANISINTNGVIMQNTSDTQEYGFQCPECGHEGMHVERVYDTFEYGSDRDQIHLNAWVPLEVCNSCATKFNTEEADRIRHDEICRHLQLLTPKEVLGIRVRHLMSQAKFAEITGIGVASLSRWESGQLMQSKSHDNLLRLTELRLNVEFLEKKSRNEVTSIVDLEESKKKIETRALSGQRFSNAATASGYFDLRKMG